jgi:hypothetical protein
MKTYEIGYKYPENNGIRFQILSPSEIRGVFS